MDIGGTAIKSAIVDPDGKLRECRTTPSAPLPPEILAQKAITVVKQYRDFDVLAVAMTGQIDHKTQITRAQSNGKRLECANFPVGRIFSEAIQKPTYVLNDANAAAFGEALHGAGQNRPDFICLTYGTGVGGGIIRNGNLLTGSRGIAGELGHMVTHAGGRQCRCGRRGCYQEYAATTALVREVKKYCPEIQNARELFDRLPAVPELQKVADDWIREIAEGLCSLAHIFDPACFVLGGGVMERDDVLEKVRQQYQEQVIPSFRDVEIVKAKLGNQAGMVGAAAFARNEMQIPYQEA